MYMSCACACAYIPERELRPSRFSSFLPRPALLAGTGVGTAVAPLHHTFLPPCLGISQNVPCDVRECVCVFLLSFSVCSSDVHCRNLEHLEEFVFSLSGVPVLVPVRASPVPSVVRGTGCKILSPVLVPVRASPERKKTDNPREGWEDGTPPPHRDFKERSVVQ